MIPVGTTVHWNFQTSGTDALRITLDGQPYPSEKKIKIILFFKTHFKDTRYTVLYLTTKELKGIPYRLPIAATPDNYQSINVEKIQDSLKMISLFSFCW